MSENNQILTEQEALKLPPRIKENRRNIRYRLFRIRENKDVVNDDLKQFIESQFEFGMSWKTFTFTWDVSPQDPLKIITEDMWSDESGGYDSITGIKSPPGFTHQS
jgi:hypothetical protein